MSKFRLPSNTEPTPTERGRVIEIATARKLGMKRHPSSGAGRIKADMSDEKAVVELKLVATARSHTVHLPTLITTLRQAEKHNKEAIYRIVFEEMGITLEGKIYRS